MPSRSSEQSGVPSNVARAMNWAKASNEITGLVRGLLADGQVNKAEADYLRRWIEDRPDLYADPIVRALTLRIANIYADGVVTPEELQELKAVLTSFAREDGAPTDLPFTTPPPVIEFQSRTFCFTGNFAYGKRKLCWLNTAIRGAEIHKAVRAGTNFLVVGSAVSKAWVNQTYGRKIEGAADSPGVAIIPEDHWLNALNSTAPTHIGHAMEEIIARLEAL